MAAMKLALLGLLIGLSSSHSAKAPDDGPIVKVVDLLSTLKEQIQLDGKTEAQLYDRTACWCTDTARDKAKKIEDAQLSLRSLGQTIMSLKGRVNTFSSEIQELQEKMDDSQSAQNDATGVRQNENRAWQAEQAELKQTLKAIAMALNVLVQATSDNSDASLLQQKTETKAAIVNVLEALPAMASIGADKIALLSSFTKDGYTPQSGTLQGILSDMYATFASDLESTTQTESVANKNFEELMSTKKSEVAHWKKAQNGKKATLVEDQARLADTMAAYDDTKSTMTSDIDFFDEVQASCRQKSKEWMIRRQMRNDELSGVSKALEMLSSDDARNLFASAIKPGKEVKASADFLQISEQNSDSGPVNQAYAILKKRASASKSLRLAQLAVDVKMAGDDDKVGHFTPVIEAIDNMISSMKEEDKADIEKRDQCKAELHKINTTKAKLQWNIKTNDAKISKLESLMQLRESQREEAIQDTNELRKQMKDMTDQRDAENNAFLVAEREDQEAIKLLKNAQDALSSYYKKNQIDMGRIQAGTHDVVLAQQDPEFENGDSVVSDRLKFTDSGSRKQQSKGIISIITMVIEDLQDELANGQKAETESLETFEESMKKAKEVEADLVQKTETLGQAIANRREDKVQVQSEKRDTVSDLNDELEYEESITPDCSFMLNQFYYRAERRHNEMDALTQAKGFLAQSNLDNSGSAPVPGAFLAQAPASASALLQGKHRSTFDDDKLPGAAKSFLKMA